MDLSNVKGRPCPFLINSTRPGCLPHADFVGSKKVSNRYIKNHADFYKISGRWKGIHKPPVDGAIFFDVKGNFYGPFESALGPANPQPVFRNRGKPIQKNIVG
jgi:hypothetical protein